MRIRNHRRTLADLRALIRLVPDQAKITSPPHSGRGGTRPSIIPSVHPEGAVPPAPRHAHTRLGDYRLLSSLHLGIGTAICCVMWAVYSSAETISIGEGRSEVIKRLGKPQGQAVTAQQETLFYKQGSIDLTNGWVSAVRMISPEKTQQERKRLRDDAAARTAQAEKKRQSRIREGISQKLKMYADPDFQDLSPGERLTYWIKFQDTYPDVPVTNEIDAAQREIPKAKNSDVAAKIEELEREIEEVTHKLHKTGISRLKRRYHKQRRLLREEVKTLREQQQAPEGF